VLLAPGVAVARKIQAHRSQLGVRVEAETVPLALTTLLALRERPTQAAVAVEANKAM